MRLITFFISPVQGGATLANDSDVLGDIQIKGIKGENISIYGLKNKQLYYFKITSIYSGVSDGQLGNGTFENSSSSTEVIGVDGAIDISMGYANACAMLVDGAIRYWRRNNVGEFGSVQDCLATNLATPVNGLERMKKYPLADLFVFRILLRKLAAGA